MNVLLAVLIGGGVGTVARYTLGRWVTNLYTPLPLRYPGRERGCLLVIGLFIGFADHKQWMSPIARWLVVGFCGDFSTLSELRTETLRSMHAGHHGSALLYTVGSVVLCVLATSWGH